MSAPVDLDELTRDLGVALRVLVEPLLLAAYELEQALWAERKGQESSATDAWCAADTVRGDLAQLARLVGAPIPWRGPRRPAALYDDAFPRREREHEVTPEQALRLVYEVIERSKP